MAAGAWKAAAKRWRARALELEVELEEQKIGYEGAINRVHRQVIQLRASLNEQHEQARQASWRHHNAEERMRRLEEEKRKTRW